MQLTPDQASFLIQVLTAQLKAEHQTTLNVMRAVPSDQAAYQPDPRSMSALDLVWHIASVDFMFLDAAAAGAFGSGDGQRPASLPDTPAIIEFYAAEFPAKIDAISALSGEQLLKQMALGPFNETALGYLQLMLVHTVHHRGQLSAYLRPMGGKVPSIYGGSADQPMSTEAAAG